MAHGSTGLKIGIVGLDTSHTVAFTKLLQDPATPPEQRIGGMRVVQALRLPSPFQSEQGQDERQAALESLGVVMRRSIAEVASGVDALFLELNDPAVHLEVFRQVAGFGLPVFIDKPLAANLVEAREIVALARARGTDTWSSSSLRFLRKLVAARRQAAAPPAFCNVFGALGKAAAGSDVVWYGCHVTEMVVTIMGPGAQTVSALEDPSGIVAAVTYAGGRRAVAEYNRGSFAYGGRLQVGNDVAFFDSAGDVLYANLLAEIRTWLETGKAPVSLDESLEVQAILEAVERSLERRQAVAVAR